MACNHKFQQYLNCENLTFNPETLIIGTFNPVWPIDNYSTWFYGRTNNNYFWEILPRMFGLESLRIQNAKLNWTLFCNRKKVAITDLIYSIDDANQNNENHLEIISKFKDTEFAETFNDFVFTNIIKILNDNKSIKSVYFTRKAGIELFDDQINTIKNYCETHKIYFSNLVTPSKNARFQMRGWNPENPNLTRNLPNFIYSKWLENWN